MPVASPTAPASPPVPATSGGSSTTRLIPARRASAASRPSRSVKARPRIGFEPFRSRAGRSMTSRSTARPASSEPAIDRPSSGSAGVRTTSHSGLIPRATTSTGSSAAARSSQATIEPAACAAAASRSASVVRPLDRSPRSATPMPRGTPPGPRMASSSAKPVERTRSRSGCGSAPSDSSGTVASAPTTSPANPGAAAPQRDRRVARAALRSVSGAGIGRPVSNKCSNESSPTWNGRTSTGPLARPPPSPRLRPTSQGNERRAGRAHSCAPRSTRTSSDPCSLIRYDRRAPRTRTCPTRPSLVPQSRGAQKRGGAQPSRSTNPEASAQSGAQGPHAKIRTRSRGLAPHGIGPWGCSSAGRAPRSHRGGQGFESPHLHHSPHLTGACRICPGLPSYRSP